MKKILVSGVQATGALHIGNYFGALKQNIDLGNSGEYESFVFIADYHALTTVKNKEDVVKNTFDAACAYLALGLDPQKVTLFKQSDVKDVHELTWIFNTVTTMPYLMRAHAYKDHEAKNKEVNVGLFDYPVLMASDILIYGADIVPVGSDQKQHVEYARDIAQKFNLTWGDYFNLPKDYIVEGVATVPGIDGEKMSKSKGNTIPLFGSDSEIKKAVMGIVTDSAGATDEKSKETPLFKIAKVFIENKNTNFSQRFAELGEEMVGSFNQSNINSFEEFYSKNKTNSYGEIKKWLLNEFMDTFKNAREEYIRLQNNPDEVYAILEEGGARARARAEETMREVRKMVGLD